MKIKTSEATKEQLNWLVAKCEKTPVSDSDLVKLIRTMDCYKVSTDWALGGPIIEREEIDTYCHESPKSGCGWWVAEITGTKAKGRGNSPLEAAMRVYVASKLGDEVEVPDELA